MKKFLTLLSGAMLIAFMLNCDGGGGSAIGAGGPDVSPDDVDETMGVTVEVVSENLSQLTTPNPSEGEGNDEGSGSDSDGEEPAAEEPAQEETPAFTYKLDTTAGRWFDTPAEKLGTADKAIQTYWANEPLYLRVEKVQQAGWYMLEIDAKNNGELPNFYKQFNISVFNETTDEGVGGIQINASDEAYKIGSMRVYLAEGDTDLLLKWTNDAYREGKYDANIQISNVSLALEEAEAPRYQKGKLVRMADEYSSVDGRFFWDNNSVRTYWADQTIGFSFPDLEPGKYRVTIHAKNYGSLPLPDNYDHFRVAVEGDGTSGEARISATEKGWRHGSTVLDLTGGDTEIFLTWLNDSYREDEYDANIQIHKIQLQRVGDSERSALAAYLLGSTAGNTIMIIGALAFLLTTIICITLLNKRRARFQL
jgi:hypothetical protein